MFYQHLTYTYIRVSRQIVSKRGIVLPFPVNAWMWIGLQSCINWSLCRTVNSKSSCDNPHFHVHWYIQVLHLEAKKWESQITDHQAKLMWLFMSHVGTDAQYFLHLAQMFVWWNNEKMHWKHLHCCRSSQENLLCQQYHALLVRFQFLLFHVLMDFKLK